MRTVVVTYRQEEDGTWIGTSADVPGYVGHGDSFDQARRRVQEGLPWFAEEEDMLIAHVSLGRASDSMTQAPKVGFGITSVATPQRAGFRHQFSPTTAA